MYLHTVCALEDPLHTLRTLNKKDSYIKHINQWGIWERAKDALTPSLPPSSQPKFIHFHAVVRKNTPHNSLAPPPPLRG